MKRRRTSARAMGIAMMIDNSMERNACRRVKRMTLKM